MEEARQRAESASEQCTSLEVSDHQQDYDYNDDDDDDDDHDYDDDDDHDYLVVMMN